MYPSNYKLGAVLSASSSLCSIELGKQIHGYITKYQLESDTSVGNSLCTFYSKCGNLESVVKAFRRISEKNVIFLPLSVITGRKISFFSFLIFKTTLSIQRALANAHSFQKFRQRNVPPDIAEMGLIFFGGHGTEILALSSSFAVFGMNVGGVPWTTQRDPSVKDGFWNVLLLCGAMMLFLAVCFTFRALYTRISAWTLRKKKAFRSSASFNRKSCLGRTGYSNGEHAHGHYVRI